MTINHPIRRWVACLALVAVAFTTVAPAAEAKNKHRHKHHKSRGCDTQVVRRAAYRPHYDRPRYDRPRYVTARNSSCDAPGFAGFLGGLVVGAVLSSASQAHAEPVRFYQDPYCDDRFESLDVYLSHCRSHRHPRVVRVIEVSSGDCVETLGYRDGNWHRGYDDDRYDDDRYYDD